MKKNIIVASVAFALVTVASFSVYRSFFQAPLPGSPAAPASTVEPSRASGAPEPRGLPEVMVKASVPGSTSAAASVPVPDYEPSQPDAEKVVRRWVENEGHFQRAIEQATTAGPQASVFEKEEWKRFSEDVTHTMRVLCSGTLSEATEFMRAKGGSVLPALLEGEQAERESYWLSLTGSYREAVFELDRIKLFVRAGHPDRTPMVTGFGEPKYSQVSSPGLDAMHSEGIKVVEVAIPGVYLTARREPEFMVVGFLFARIAPNGRWRPIGKIDYDIQKKPTLLPW